MRQDKRSQGQTSLQWELKPTVPPSQCGRQCLPVTSSPDYLIGLEEERRGDGQAQFLRGLQVDDQLELHGPLDGQVGRLGAVEDLRHQTGFLPEYVGQVWPIGHEATVSCKAGDVRNGREVMRHGEGSEVLAVI